jgi:1-aminocyclopropane-1-carboxylate deaminase/D-cysteine desulfhydrase-like pyridoxal-dependent ACC family enzyme
MTAAAACVAGLRAVLVLTKKWAMPRVEGNLFLDYLYGAEMRFVNSVDDRLAVGHDDEAVAEVVKNEAAQGRKAYVIPVGGSSAVGAVGYVTGTRELLDQLQSLGARPSRLYYASGSRGTQAGLALGAKLHGAPYRLWGVAVSGGEAEKIQRARRVANEAAALLEASTRVDLDELFTDQGFIGEGYGVPTDEGLDAIRLLARTEAILLDPVYTSKGFAALLRHVRAGEVGPDETIVFLHTGGMPALFTREFKSRSQAFRS